MGIGLVLTTDQATYCTKTLKMKEHNYVYFLASFSEKITIINNIFYTVSDKDVITMCPCEGSYNNPEKLVSRPEGDDQAT